MPRPPPTSAPSRRRRALLAAGAALLALALGAAWILLGGLRAPLRFEAGRAYDYRLAYRGDEAVDLAAGMGAPAGGSQGQVKARFAVEGTLRLTALGERDGATRLSVGFPEVGAVSLELLGQAALPSPEAAREALVGPEAELLLGPDGAPRALRFPPGAPPLFQRVVEAVLSEGRLDLRTGQARWEVAERGQRGEAEVTWRAWRSWRGLGEDRAVKVKRRYRVLHALPRGLDGLDQALEARLEATLSAGGELRQLTSRERLVVKGADGAALVDASVDLSLTLVRVGPAAAPAELEAGATRLAAAVAAAPPVQLDRPAGAGTEEAALARVATGSDLTALLAQLSALGPDGTLPRDFMWRGSAWLRLHPEDIATLVARFGGLPPEGRRAAVTLLVATGSGPAQAALRGLLADPAHRRDEGRPQWLSTLSFLETPEPDTLRLLQAEAWADGPGGPPATLALGSAIRRASGEAAPLAAELNTRLQVELRTTGDAERRQAVLTAMANAGRAENVAEAARFAADPAPGVRAAAANAVRRTQTPEAERLLLTLAADADRPVQAVALQTLAGFQLDAGRLERLTALVRSGAIGELGFPDLVQLVGQARAAGAPAASLRALLAAMAERPIRRQEIRDLVDRALGP